MRIDPAKHMKVAPWLILAAILALTGCVTSPPSSADAAADAAAKKFQPPAGKANLYIARAHDNLGNALRFKLSLDGSALGTIAQGNYYLVSIEPGAHHIEVDYLLSAEKAVVEAKAGKNYFFEVTATSGGSGTKIGLSMVLLEEMGKLMVKQDKIAPKAK